jgi:hypothetical protein
MSRLYMSGTAHQELEQMMMLMPNFIPRGSEVIVLKKYKKKNRSMNCKDCADPFDECHRACLCPYMIERLASQEIEYESIVISLFQKYSSVHLKRRLDYLSRNFDGEIFLNPKHRCRFHRVIEIQNLPIENRNSIFLAILYLLTADDKLWDAARDNIYLDCFDFKNMHLKGINTDGYAIYQMARTIYSAKEYIKLDEIADKNLIGDEAFKVIINSILIAKYGAAIFQVKC